MKLIILALALFATGADAACTIPNFANTQPGIVGDAAGANSAGGGACAAGTLANGASCDVKCDTGYTCDSGTTVFTCAAGADTLDASAEIATTGCAVMWKQTDTNKAPVVAKTAADGTAGTCTQCTADGEYVAAAAFGDTAGACIQCPTDVMGTAGTCAEGCPADAYQTGGADAAGITCAACDKTKYKLEAAGQAVMDASTTAQTGTASTGCAAAGCRADYEQTAGAADAAADCIETATKANADSFCTAIDAIDTVQCNAISQPANLAACEAVKKQKADGTGATTTAACTYTAAVATASVTATKNACDGANVPANAAACTSANAGCEIKNAVTAVAVVCKACAAGFVTQTNAEQTGAVNTGAATCLPCNPLIAGKCRTGCPANYYQKAGTTAGDIQCLACPSGKELANAGVLTTVQTETACTTPAAAASGAFRSVANAAATAVAASFAAAALM